MNLGITAMLEKEAAKEIWQEGCCLEEYVTQN